MDPNKGHGENIRTHNWTENGRRSFFGRPTMAASRRPESTKRGTERLSFSPLRPTNPRRSPTRRAYEPEGSRFRRTGIAMGLATPLQRRSKTTKYPKGISIGGRGLIFEFDTQRSISSLVGPAPLERAIL